MTDLGSSIAYVTYNPGGPFMQALRAGFAELGVDPAHLIVVSPRERLVAEWRRRRLGMIPRTLAPRLRTLTSARLARTPGSAAAGADAAQGPSVVHLKRLNSPELLEAIRSRGIRYLVNGGAGIFREPLVSVPDLVIVNAHAGALPAFRNMNVVEWALYTGAPVVGTVHRIDAGIDTGPILLERRLDLSGAHSVLEAREIAFEQVARLVAPAVVAHARGEIDERRQPREGTRWYVMHPYLRGQLDRRLAGAEHGKG
jgi:folate-dependent phosphoribosylglycinamide formyltransferase PurN